MSALMPGKSSTCLLGLFVVLMLSACSSIGPGTVQRDRFDYNGTVARSWKEQTLLNMVKVRYMEFPVFLDISQIIAGYTLEGTAQLGAQVRTNSGPAAVGDIVSAGVAGRWQDRPTITYTPLTGALFNKNMMTPIPPSSVLFLMQAGWPADLILRLTIQSINGVDQAGATAARFDRVATLLRQLQLNNEIGMRVQPKGKGPYLTHGDIM